MKQQIKQKHQKPNKHMQTQLRENGFGKIEETHVC
jgi:hypothetical protein